MARKPRLELTGSLYYVVIRGNQKQRVFHDNEDGFTFIDRVSRYKDRYGFPLYAYVMMPNAVHLLLEDTSGSISKIMQGIQQSYTQYYNRKYRINGHVFQGRFQAYIVEKEKYLLEFIRHIHLYPVNEKIALEPEAYVWSGHYELLEKREPLINWKSVLTNFAQSIPEGFQKYRAFIQEGKHKKFEFPVEGRQIIGSKEFARDVFRKSGFEKSLDDERPRLPLERLTTLASEFFGIPAEDILGDSKYHDISAARSALMYAAVEKLKIPNRDVSEFLRRSPATVSLQIQRIKSLLRTNEDVRGRIDAFIGKIELELKSS